MGQNKSNGTIIANKMDQNKTMQQNEIIRQIKAMGQLKKTKGTKQNNGRLHWLFGSIFKDGYHLS
jgi:hypothetical protein